jgi:peroxiredoxin
MDSVESHKKFWEKLQLPFDLLADVEKKAHQAYGFKGMTRALFLVGKDGKIRFVNRKFDLKKESWDELYKALGDL